MVSSPLDAVDRGILYHLQQDAKQPITNIADKVDVANNTVRNRIDNLEEEGVIAGYTVNVRYNRAAIPFYRQFIGSARPSEREAMAENAEEVPGVTEVTTLMTGDRNILIKAVALTKEEVTEIAYELDDLGIEIDREPLIWRETHHPFSGFHVEENG